MDPEVWDALGLAGPTSDKAAIRLAYAARLKTLDLDTDAAAFIRLRAAYDRAQAWETSPAPVAQFEAPPEEDWGARPMPRPEWWPPIQPKTAEPQTQSETREPGTRKAKAEPPKTGRKPVPPSPPDPYFDVRVTPQDAAAFRAAFDAAVRAGKLAPLEALYREGLARALIPLGMEQGPLAQLLRVALADPAVTIADLRALAARYGVNTGVPTGLPHDLNEALVARQRAQDWYEAQRILARRWVSLNNPFPARAARFLTGRWKPGRLWSGDAPHVKVLVEIYRGHGPHLGAAFDEARADKLNRRIDWVEHPGPIRRWWPWVFLGAILTFAIIGTLTDKK